MLKLSFAVIKTPAEKIAFGTVRGLSWKMPPVALKCPTRANKSSL